MLGVDAFGDASGVSREGRGGVVGEVGDGAGGEGGRACLFGGGGFGETAL